MESLLTWIRLAAPDGRPDAELLAAFLADHDERALAEVVRRHGPVVWGVCRRTLPDPVDAEDAFQATFLVLVRRGYRPPAPLGPWLYRVAVLTARGLRRRNARRLARRAALPDDVPARQVPDAVELDGLLMRMPEKYRAAVVLCHLEGLSEREAADRVGCPVGTLSARVSRGLTWLRARSVADPRAVMALAAAVSVPAATTAAAVRTAVVVQAASQAAGAVPAAVVQLANEVSRNMLLTKLRIGLLTLPAVLLVVAAGVAALAGPADRADPRPSARPPAPPVPAGPGADAEVDVTSGTQVVIGTHRVTLLSVTRFTELVAGPGGKPPQVVTSVRMMYLLEDTGDGPLTVVAGGEVLAAGTTDRAIRRADPGGDQVPPSAYYSSENFSAYAKRVERQGSEWTADKARLPAVGNPDRAVVLGVTWHDVRVSAGKADLRVQVGGPKGGRVVFKNVPLE